MRRTPPVTKQVIPPFRSTNALLKARLIDFDTGSASLEQQHIQFLIQAINRAKANPAGFHIQIIGFASHLGNEQFNQALSLKRVNSVIEFLKHQVQNGVLLRSLKTFEAVGESQSGGGGADDSPEFRAVEIHIFIGEIPPIDPPNVKPIPRPLPAALPGGPRFKDWEIGYTSIVETSIPGLPPFFVVGLHVFVIRAMSGKNIMQEHGYVVPAVGPGLSIPLKDLLKIMKHVFNFLKGGLSSGKVEVGLDFKNVATSAPATFEEIEASLVSISGAGGGFVVGFGIVHVNLAIPDILQFSGLSNTPIHRAESVSLTFTSSLQLGGKVAATVGGLKRID